MTEHKIKTLEELAVIVDELKKEGKTVVQCHGTFDLMHPGHIKHFEAAKREGDVLVVTLTPDRHVKKGIGRPVFSEDLRAGSIAALACVDYVALDKNPAPYETIRLLKPNVFVKGQDYEGKEREEGHPSWQEKQIVDSYGGRYHFTHETTASSSALLNAYFSNYPEETKAFLRDLKGRHSFKHISEIVTRMRNLKVLVVGDTILDVYHYSTPLGRSLKEEILRVKIIETEMFAGGAVAVANTMAGFCENVGLLTMLGRKEPDKEKKQERFITDHLMPNITPYFCYREDAPTVVNERFAEKVFLKKFFGLYQIEESPLPEKLEKEIGAMFERIVPQYDIVLVTDYGLGFLTPFLIQKLADLSRFFAVNTQTNSANMGFNFITKYPRADYISISTPEMRFALHERHAPVEDLVKTVADRLGTKAATVTLGHRGALIYADGKHNYIPVLSQKVIDRIGAGDAYLTVSTPCIFLGADAELAGFLGNVAGGIACTIVANKETVDSNRLLRAVETLLK